MIKKAIGIIHIPLVCTVFGIMCSLLAGWIGQYVDFRSWYSFGAWMAQAIVLLVGIFAMVFSWGYFFKGLLDENL